jgi:hypothetical protein
MLIALIIIAKSRNNSYLSHRNTQSQIYVFTHTHTHIYIKPKWSKVCYNIFEPWKLAKWNQPDIKGQMYE